MSVYKNDNPIYFRQAVKSIYDEQLVKPSEIVLVKDGPLNDELYEEIFKLKDRLGEVLKVINLDKNMGLGIALSKGLIECTNELVARMDSDDISVPNRFKDQIDIFVNNPGLCILGGNIAEFMEEKNNIVGTRNVYQSDLEIKKDMKYRCALNHVTVMFKKSKIIEIGNYLDWFCNEDYYLWIRALQNDLVFKNLDKVLVYVRVGIEMYGRRGGIKYFYNEVRLQKYMLNTKIISMREYIKNVSIRFVVQVILPSRIRRFIYIRFLREKSLGYNNDK